VTDEKTAVTVPYAACHAIAALKSVTPKGPPSESLIFESVSGDVVHQTFRKARNELGIADFRFHDLRHTAASWLRMTGADIHSVAILLGHKDLRMTAATVRI